MNLLQRNCNRRLLGALLCAALPLALQVGAVADAPHKRLSTDDKISIALNRLAFGARPGDVEAVRKMGLRAWIDQQLTPDKIDDSVVDKKLATLPTLKMSPQEMFDGFKDDQMQIQQRIRANGGLMPNGQQAPGQRPGAMPNGPAGAGATLTPSPDSVGRAVQPPAGQPGVAPRYQGAQGQPMMDGQAMSPQMRGAAAGMRPGQNSIRALGELSDSKLLRACESNRQLQEVLVDFWTNHFNVDVKKGQVRAFKPIDDRDVIRPHVLGKFRELLEASAKSPAMLFYLDNALSTRDLSDPNSGPAMGPGGQFRPGMGPGGFRRPGAGFGGQGQGRGPLGASGAAGGPDGRAPMAGNVVGAAGPQRPGAPAGRRLGGLNENYGRELLELHTLGVDGGYTEKDVREVARCFTGWSIDRAAGVFRFFPFLHDNGEKTVLGHKIPPGGGIKDGEMVLDIVAAHPATARHIALKLCQRFVADAPPKSLVDRAAKTFEKSGGDLREVVRTIVTSNEFLSPAAFRSKMKSPFVYAASAIRALGGTFDLPDPAALQGSVRLVTDGAISMGYGAAGRPNGPFQRVSLVKEIALMGEPLFSHEAPTGYPEDSREWVSSGSLLARFNFAQDLTGGRIAAVGMPLSALQPPANAKDHKAALAAMSRAVVGDQLSDTTREAILREMDNGADGPKTLALLLGSPEFQRH